MTRDDPPLRIRLPETLKAKLKARSAENHRSMNAEIIACLEAAFAGSTEQGVVYTTAPSASVNDLQKQIDRLRERMDRLEGKLVADADVASEGGSAALLRNRGDRQ